MPTEDPVSAAQARLRSAIERLEHAVEMRLERDSIVRNVDAEIQRMTTDRAKLAGALDSALARGERLEKMNREVSQRLVDAMETVRSVLDRHR